MLWWPAKVVEGSIVCQSCVCVCVMLCALLYVLLSRLRGPCMVAVAGVAVPLVLPLC